MRLYHGSDKMVETPSYGVGNPHNDYGLGFYCTQQKDLAGEWACSESTDGFVNEYELDLEDLTVLYLNDGRHSILNWLSILLENRRFDLSTPVAVQARDYILGNYLPQYKDFDVIIGYRADDSYFSFARAFLANGITLEQLGRAMKLGKLGEQVVVMSEKAFSSLHFVAATPVESRIFYPRRVVRDRNARNDYLSILSEPLPATAVYVSDLINGKSLR
ncbi:MAG: DUF3990 domain-containing protein [Bacteroidales bacterium]|nr:DUF3990 domain-containing protein [Bacteroidales bacterium]